MIRKREARAEAARLVARFEAAGAECVEAPVLLQAGTFLDLYGEDIRTRAYVTHDPDHGEMMLRPDFTVPVVERHMALGAEPARYAYTGEVFRAQDENPTRRNEYLQVGYEVFDRENPEQADAEVFALVAGELAPLGLHAATGDIGILTAAVLGLQTTDRRRAALMRHIWRPRRFRALLDRFAGRCPVPEARQELLAGDPPAIDLVPVIGLRSKQEIEARIAVLREDAEAAPLSEAQVDVIEALQSVRETCPNAIEQLRDIAVDLPAITSALDRLERRVEALSAFGIDVDGLDFEASFGRTSMEYYDGFVFGFYAHGRPDLPPVATGGRYDALTRQLGGGTEIPAVGGVIRPELVIELRGETS